MMEDLLQSSSGILTDLEIDVFRNAGMWKQRFVKEEKTKMQKMGGLQERKVAVAWWKLHKGGDMGFMV
jgi:hypothetical protein